MPLIRCKMVGSGGDLDPFRVPLPSYTSVLTDYAALTDVVNISPRIWPPALDHAQGTVHTSLNGISVVTGASVDTMAAWYAILDRSYFDNGMLYRPEIA